MKAEFHRGFDKQFTKLPPKRRAKVMGVIELFLDDPTNPTLRNHSLSGNWAGFHSISAGGDLRIHFQTIDDKTVYFVAVGTHSQLYKS